jgi:hypothetical protein
VIRVLRTMSGMQLFAVFVAIVVVVVFVFLLTSDQLSFNSDEDDGVLGPDTSEVQSSADEPDASVDLDGADGADTSSATGGLATQVAQDQAFQFGDLRLAVTDIIVSTIVSEGRDSIEAIERFATVFVTARNTGLTPLSLAGNLILIDGAGRQFTPNLAATVATAFRDDSRQDALSFDLQPGLDSDLLVVFDIPEESENFRLRIAGGFVDVILER